MLGGSVRRVGCLLLALCTVLGIGACSQERVRPSDTLPPTSRAPTTGESPTPTPTAVSGPNGIVPLPVPNARFGEQSEIGALAFNEYWTMTLDYLYATLDVEPFRSVSSPECTFCTYVIDLHGPRRDQGYIYQGGRFTIEGSVVNSFAGATATVTTIVSITELVVTDPQGNRDPESEGGHPRFQLVNYLSWTGQGWVVVDANGGDL